jgi:DUF438 domain-containing protein
MMSGKRLSKQRKCRVSIFRCSGKTEGKAPGERICLRRNQHYRSMIKLEKTEEKRGVGHMKIPNTNITLEALLDQLPMRLQYVDKDGVLRYLNKADAAHPANGKREVGVNIKDCHARPESLEMIERIFEDFRQGRKEPDYYVTSTGTTSIKVPVFDEQGEFIGVLSFSHPVGMPTRSRTF